MTQASLQLEPEPSTRTYRDRAEAIFRSQPNRWIHWTVFAEQCGALGWRTRISNVRRECNMNIRNRVRRDAFGTKHSYYKFEVTL